MIRKPSRPGATLTEVLVAIFVMAIGLLALLTLFPLGALSMAQAIKDNRTAHSGKNAFAIAEALNLHGDSFVSNNGNFLGAGAIFQGGGAPPVPPNTPNYFSNPYPGVPQTAAGQPQTPNLAPDLNQVSWDGPSYPIYVDPWGWNLLKSSPTQALPNLNAAPNNAPALVPYWTVGNIPLPTSGGVSAVPRLPVSSLANAPLPNQWLTHWCTLSDDITFNEDGTPSSSTGAVQRENRYTWAWMLRRPKASDSSVVDTTVVVYSGRSVTTLGETPFPDPTRPLGPTNQFVAFDPTSKFVDIFYTGTKPSIRTGSWILDATMAYYVPTAQANIPDPHGFFYRVVGVTDLSSNSMRLELQTNPRKASFYTTATGPVPYGVLIVMENVVEVFEKGPGWQP